MTLVVVGKKKGTLRLAYLNLVSVTKIKFDSFQKTQYPKKYS